LAIKIRPIGKMTAGSFRGNPRFTPVLKKGAEQLTALSSEYPAGDRQTVVEPAISANAVEGVSRAAFGVDSAIDQSVNPGVEQGAHAHQAGFEGNIEGGATQAVVASFISPLAKNENFRVGSRVMLADRPVASLGKHPFRADQYRTNRDFATHCGGTGLGQGPAHPQVVVHHST
jgi:hypothetical protein